MKSAKFIEQVKHAGSARIIGAAWYNQSGIGKLDRLYQHSASRHAVQNNLVNMTALNAEQKEAQA